MGSPATKHADWFGRNHDIFFSHEQDFKGINVIKRQMEIVLTG